MPKVADAVVGKVLLQAADRHVGARRHDGRPVQQRAAMLCILRKQRPRRRERLVLDESRHLSVLVGVATGPGREGHAAAGHRRILVVRLQAVLRLLCEERGPVGKAPVPPRVTFPAAHAARSARRLCEALYTPLHLASRSRVKPSRLLVDEMAKVLVARVLAVPTSGPAQSCVTLAGEGDRGIPRSLAGVGL